MSNPVTKLKDLDLPVVLGRCSEVFGDRRKRKFAQLPGGTYIPLKWLHNIKRLLRSKDANASVKLFGDLMVIFHHGGQTLLEGEDLDEE